MPTFIWSSLLLLHQTRQATYAGTFCADLLNHFWYKYAGAAQIQFYSYADSRGIHFSRGTSVLLENLGKMTYGQAKVRNSRRRHSSKVCSQVYSEVCSNVYDKV